MTDAPTEYVRGEIGKPFVWGERDCIAFADAAIAAHTGAHPFREWLGTYKAMRGAVATAVALRKAEGGPVAAADARWHREMTLHPRHGALVGRSADGSALRFAFGVVVAGMAAFVTQEAGVQVVPLTVFDRYWTVT